jgi:hypothetical protein
MVRLCYGTNQSKIKGGLINHLFLFYGYLSLKLIMKKRIRLTESELVKLVKRVVIEQTEEKEDVLSEIIDDEIRVYEDKIRELCKGIGEGIDEINADSRSMTGKWKPNTDEMQNEVDVTFIDNAYGHISLDEWGRLERKLNKFVGEGGFVDFAVNPKRNKLTLEFDGEFPMGLY